MYKLNYRGGEVDKLLQKIDNQQSLIEISYKDLKSLRDNSQLIPGQQYRIIDYVTTCNASNARSAGHQFDIIVTADDINVLNENARAIQHEGDTYFANSNLAAWELKYCIDNYTNRFSWADDSTGATLNPDITNENREILARGFMIELKLSSNLQSRLNEGLYVSDVPDTTVLLKYLDYFVDDDLNFTPFYACQVGTGHFGIAADFTDWNPLLSGISRDILYSQNVPSKDESNYGRIPIDKDTTYKVIYPLEYKNELEIKVQLTDDEFDALRPYHPHLSTKELILSYINSPRYSYDGYGFIAYGVNTVADDWMGLLFPLFDLPESGIPKDFTDVWGNAHTGNEIVYNGQPTGIFLSNPITVINKGNLFTTGPTGKGIIYQMTDEFNNSCPYDFKNIQFTTDNQSWHYTFYGETLSDASLNDTTNVHDNWMGRYIDGKQMLNNIHIPCSELVYTTFKNGVHSFTNFGNTSVSSVTVAINSNGETKVYNEADLVS